MEAEDSGAVFVARITDPRIHLYIECETHPVGSPYIYFEMMEDAPLSLTTEANALALFNMLWDREDHVPGSRMVAGLVMSICTDQDRMTDLIRSRNAPPSDPVPPQAPYITREEIQDMDETLRILDQMQQDVIDDWRASRGGGHPLPTTEQPRITIPNDQGLQP